MTDLQVTIWACPRCGDPEDGTGIHTADQCVTKLKAELVQRLRELADARADIDKTNNICLEVMRERDEAHKVGLDYLCEREEAWRQVDAMEKQRDHARAVAKELAEFVNARRRLPDSVERVLSARAPWLYGEVK